MLDEDVISTNRQSINWDNSEMEEFRKFLSGLISQVSKEWRKKRADKKDKELQEETGINKEQWFSTLPEGVRESVEAIVKGVTQNDDVSESLKPIVKALYALVPEYPLLHWRHLHDTIKSGVFDYYKNQQYGHAADQATKLYAQKLREISEKDVDGVELADLFSIGTDKKKITKLPVIQLSDLSTDSKINMQDGQNFLTRGLIKGFRNPINHAPMSAIVPNVLSEVDCLNILSLISYLATRLNSATVNKTLSP